MLLETQHISKASSSINIERQETRTLHCEVQGAFAYKSENAGESNDSRRGSKRYAANR